MTEVPVPPANDVTPLGYSSSAPGSIELDKDARLWGMLAHLSSLVGLVIPFGSFIGPLTVWLIKKNEIPFADEQGKESLNFQLTVLIALVVSFVLMFVLIGFILLPLVGIAALVFIIIASVKANNGEHYRYPVSIRFIK
ncbi:MAG TPA: DUF4870 domain-containing protein [Tepidisphaeraceae bacterium]